MIIGSNNFGKAQNICFGTGNFPPQSDVPAHVHPKDEEIIYILTGKGEIYFDGIAKAIEQGICMYIPPGVRHIINNK